MSAKSLSILVVDDHRDSLNMLGMLLEILGHVPELAPNADLALTMACGKRFDALVTDVHMPGMDGWTLVRELNARTCLPTRVISMSAGALDSEKEVSKEVGCHAHLRKPFKSNELEAALWG